MRDIAPLGAGVLASVGGSLAASDELQSLLVALAAIAVREIVYWWRNRRKKTSSSSASSG